MSVSAQTVGILIERAAELGHGSLTTLLTRAGADADDPGEGPGKSREKRAGAALRGALKRKNDRGLIDVARLLLRNGDGDAADPTEGWVVELVSALRHDGYVLERTSRPGPPGRWGDPTVIHEWKIGPLGTEELPLPPQAASVERLLSDKGFPVAANHFGQAYRAYTGGDLEASNSQLRPALEDVLIETARSQRGWTGTKGGVALDTLKGGGLIDAAEHEFLHGVWALSHQNGSHPGFSNEQEALFRFSTITAAIQFLVWRFS